MGDDAHAGVTDPLEPGLQVVAAPSQDGARSKPAPAEASVARHSTLNFIGSAVPIVIYPHHLSRADAHSSGYLRARF